MTKSIKKTAAASTTGERRNRRMAREAAPSETSALTAAPARTPSKTEQVLTLLRRDGGATLAELVAATGWQPHTTRAALTGLRKKHHAIVRTRRDDMACYHIEGAA